MVLGKITSRRRVQALAVWADCVSELTEHGGGLSLINSSKCQSFISPAVTWLCWSLLFCFLLVISLWLSNPSHTFPLTPSSCPSLAGSCHASALSSRPYPPQANSSESDLHLAFPVAGVTQDTPLLFWTEQKQAIFHPLAACCSLFMAMPVENNPVSGGRSMVSNQQYYTWPLDCWDCFKMPTFFSPALVRAVFRFPLAQLKQFALLRHPMLRFALCCVHCYSELWITLGL